MSVARVFGRPVAGVNGGGNDKAGGDGADDVVGREPCGTGEAFR